MSVQHRQEKQPIVITGMGLVSTLGDDLDVFHTSLRQGRTGISSIETRYETGYSEVMAGVITSFDPEQLGKHGLPPDLGRASALAATASQSALEQAGVSTGQCALVAGTALGDLLSMESMWEQKGYTAENSSEPDMSELRANNIGRSIAAALALGGPSHTISATCASGNHAIDWACQLLRSGSADAVIAVGVDTIPYTTLLGFCRLLLQAPSLCQPFDRYRKGTILAEGAGALVLEPLDLAKQRGARVLAEVAGTGLSNDAAGPFGGTVDTITSLELAASRALQDARIAAREVDYVSAHGTGTRLNDARETRFLRSLLGDRAESVPVSSIKSMLGHASGAAASLEAIASVLTFQHDTLYPTTNYTTPDPECDLDYVPNEAREARVDVILSNSFGVGGQNAVVVLKRWNEE